MHAAPNPASSRIGVPTRHLVVPVFLHGVKKTKVKAKMTCHDLPYFVSTIVCISFPPQKSFAVVTRQAAWEQWFGRMRGKEGCPPSWRDDANTELVQGAPGTLLCCYSYARQDDGDGECRPRGDCDAGPKSVLLAMQQQPSVILFAMPSLLFPCDPVCQQLLRFPRQTT